MSSDQLGLIDSLKGYIDWMPEAYWPAISLVLAAIILFGTVVDRMSAIIGAFSSIFRSFLKKKPPNPVIREPVRVLRAVWLRDREKRPSARVRTGKEGIPIVSFINMKGGVGKTTLSGNIGAHFLSKGLRVLFIDFDYQGSLSLMVASAAGVDRLEANSDLLLQDTDYAGVKDQVHRFPKIEKAGLFAAHYILFREEMELFANWAGNSSHYDIRYALRKITTSCDFQSDWDIVIIDCGPRFTTSTINALCASTHVVIPTILDEPSTQAVGYLSKEFDDHKLDLFPQLRLLGVIPTMIAQDPENSTTPKFSKVEKEQLEAVEDWIARTWNVQDGILYSARIPDRASISKSADKIAYFTEPEAKRVFGRAGDILLKRLRNENYRV